MGLGIFVRRRETAPRFVDAGSPLDSDPDLVASTGSVRPYDPEPRSLTPTRPAVVRVTHTGIERQSWSRDPFGLHVEIDRQSGRPRGVQAPFSEPTTIPRPIPATWGSLYEVQDGSDAAQDEAVARVMGV